MSADDRYFVDTNVWLYAFLAGQDAAKTNAAQLVVQQSPLFVSVQVVNEVCVNLIRKAAMPEPDVRSLIASYFAKYTVMALDQATLLRASALRERYSISFWDSTLVASALMCQATILFPEDLQHGMVIEKTLRVVDPFRAAP